MSELSWLKEALDKLLFKVDKIDDKVDDQGIRLEKQNAVLEEHIKRTVLAEQNIELLKGAILPLKTHVDNVNLFFKISSSLVFIVAAVISIIKFLL